jgi:mono/diheme cytochrome c family protein
MRFACALATTLSLATSAATAQVVAARPKVSFARDVLPILSDRCFTCHGPDAATRKADLRFDDKSSVFAMRDGASIVVAGKPEQSELIHRITASDDDVMPPRDSKLQLSTAEIATLHQWIAEGAEWTEHWAFANPTTITAPKARQATWARNPIDSFVLRKLESVGIPPGTAAAPAALLRRVSLDLTGLPPTPAQLDAFVNDPSDAAYDRIIDKLLASPHYGERMAWPWLEASRYADTDGFQNDPTRTAWPWRDWLVRSLNDNVPFDQFTLQVLAGDQLPSATKEQRLATGFLRNNTHNGEGGRIPEETRIENIFDRTETVGTVWMGMTFECARCHDHKYDPISQNDYYSLFAFFNQTSETGLGRSGGKLPPTMRYVHNKQDRARLAALTAQIDERNKSQRRANRELDRAQTKWETAQQQQLTKSKQSLQPATLGPWLRSIRFQPGKGGPNAMFAEPFVSETTSEIRKGPDWRPAPELAEGEVILFGEGIYTDYFYRTITTASPRRMRISLGSDDAIKVWCNGKLALQNNTRRGVKADQERAELQLQKGDNYLLIKIINTGGAGGMYFRRVDETVGDLPFDVVRALLAKAPERTDAQRASLQHYYRMEHVDGFATRAQRLQTLRDEQSKLERTALDVSVMDDLPRAKRRATHVLERGDYQQQRNEVSASTPSFLPPLNREPASRLDLARWLVSGKHPLTARVAVNRAWQTLFGRGLVATTEDFGRQGDRPTHPELLDWLANRLVTEGWDLKSLHRLIVSSSTYRQSAATNAAAFATDPDNNLLARSARLRLPAWMLRDQALALSGQLAPTIGGAPVRPYQPDGIWAEATFGTIRYQQGTGEDLYRRSLYVFWRRIIGPTMLFDTQSRQACVVKRSITNTPLHALTTLNETGFVEAARGLATRAWHAAQTPDDRITWLFRAATARRPTNIERQLLTSRLQQCIDHFTADQKAADSLLAVGDTKPDATMQREQLAAFTVIASIVLNLDEVLTRP